MPTTYTVTQSRTQRMTFQSKQDSVEVTWHKDYFVDVTGAADDTLISPYEVMTATGLPVVNRTIYSLDGKIIPFVVCKHKSAEQHPKRLTRWIIKTQWRTFSGDSNQDESDNQPQTAPAALTDITPKVVSSLGEYEYVMNRDRTGRNAGNAADDKFAALTPARNFWSSPVMTKAPTLKLKITQYESSITYQQMLDRKFKVNQAQYRTKDKYSWLIENVEATEVEVLLSGGETTAALVTYSLSYRPTSWGWRERRALVDTQYIDDDGKIKPFEAKFGKSRFGFITKDGKKRADADGGQNWPPDYEDYEIYSVTDFSGFLQV